MGRVRGACAAFLVFLALPLAARDVVSISIEGLRRTDRDVVLDLLPVAAGDPLDGVTEEDLRDRLIDSGIFAEVAVKFIPADPSSDAVAIEIAIDEKWTLIPVPYFATDGDSFNGGLILFESNLFGRNKRLIAAGSGGTAGAQGFAAFIDPSIFQSRWLGSLSAASGTSDRVARERDGTLVREFDAMQNSLGGSLGFAFTDRLELVGFARYSAWQISEFRRGIDETRPADGSAIEWGLEAGWQGSRPYGSLRRGIDLRGEFRVPGEIDHWEVSGSGEAGIPTVAGQRLRLVSRAGYGSAPVIFQQDISARDGFRSLPYQASPAQRWAGGMVGYDVPIFQPDWGALVVSVYGEGGSYGSEATGDQPYLGSGTAFRIYLRQVAVPALGVDAAWNLLDRTFVFSFSIGASM